MRVLAGGVFDIIHPGHIFFLEKAASFGNELIVVVATDETAEKNKGRKPIFTQPERVELVQSIRHVTTAVPGGTGDFLDTVKAHSPDIIALGFDQKFPSLEQELSSQNLPIKVIRLKDRLGDYSSTKIIEQIEKG